MRSYYAHLETTSKSTTDQAIVPRPIFRASAIFPAIHQEGITSRILFMGYWLLKRGITELSAIVTLRSSQGKTLVRQVMVIKEPKAFRIELTPLLHLANIPTDTNFLGSLEIEFYSIVNLVFPFPAVVINYYGPNFSTVVHTAQRVYNDFEDMRGNSQTKVPESGFNIYSDAGREPFMALINGGQIVPSSHIALTFYNQNQERLQHQVHVGDLAPYQTVMLYPAREVPLEQFLNGQAGTCKVHFNVSWIFPRLIVGNFLKDLNALVITHTYYDCSDASNPSDYWSPSNPDWYPESLMVPVLQSKKAFTNVYFYPIYSPSQFFIDIEVYDENGTLLGSLPNYLKVYSPSNDFICLSFKEILERLHLTSEKPLAARIAAHTKDGEKIPARVKCALDMGRSEKHLPCNICTNLQPYNPAFEHKLSSFKWGPILADQPNAAVWIMNSAPKKHYMSEAQIKLNIYREEDTVSMERQITLPPQGFLILQPDLDPELKQFLNGNIGWFTAISSNPYTTTYYFSNNDSGVVGGDHGF